MLQKEEAERLLKQTEQQVYILKASLDRATKAKEHAEAQVRVYMCVCVVVRDTLDASRHILLCVGASAPAGVG